MNTDKRIQELINKQLNNSITMPEKGRLERLQSGNTGRFAIRMKPEERVQKLQTKQLQSNKVAKEFISTALGMAFICSALECVNVDMKTINEKRHVQRNPEFDEAIALIQKGTSLLSSQLAKNFSEEDLDKADNSASILYALAKDLTWINEPGKAELRKRISYALSRMGVDNPNV